MAMLSPPNLETLLLPTCPLSCNPNPVFMCSQQIAGREYASHREICRGRPELRTPRFGLQQNMPRGVGVDINRQQEIRASSMCPIDSARARVSMQHGTATVSLTIDSRNRRSPGFLQQHVFIVVPSRGFNAIKAQQPLSLLELGPLPICQRQILGFAISGSFGRVRTR